MDDICRNKNKFQMQAVLTYFTIIMTSMFIKGDGEVFNEASISDRSVNRYEQMKEYRYCEEYEETTYRELRTYKSNINL